MFGVLAEHFGLKPSDYDQGFRFPAEDMALYLRNAGGPFIP